MLSTRGALTVAIDTTVEERLRREGLAREIVRVVQQARRDAGVEVTDRIELRLGGSEDLLAAARAHEGYVAEETLATHVAYDGENGDGDASASARAPAPVEVEGEQLAVAVAVAQPRRRLSGCSPRSVDPRPGDADLRAARVLGAGRASRPPRRTARRDRRRPAGSGRRPR